jgi:hypothetical protein
MVAANLLSKRGRSKLAASQGVYGWGPVRNSASKLLLARAHAFARALCKLPLSEVMGLYGLQGNFLDGMRFD